MHTYKFEFANPTRTYIQYGETSAENIVDALTFVTRWVASDWDEMEVISIEEVN